MTKRISVVGGGNGGQAAAVDLTSRGFDVCLYEFLEFSKGLERKIESKIIPAKGFVNGDIKIAGITTNEDEIADFSRTILVTMPAFGHKRFFDVFKDKLQEGSSVYFLPGNLASFTALRDTDVFKRDITLVEFCSLPYGCRIRPDGSVSVSIRTKMMSYAAFPAKKTESVIEEVDKLYPGQRRGSDILEVAIDNPNPLIHPPGVLLNLGRIEHSNGQFYMYNEGMTDSVMRVIESVNRERHNIAKALDYRIMDFSDYGGKMVDGRTENFIQCGKEALMLGPTSRENRYLTEDALYGLVYWSEIGKKAGISTPNIDAEIVLTSTVCGLSFKNQIDLMKVIPNGKDRIRNFLFDGSIN